MITFFSIPKPFKGHISIIQENAIQSWLLLRPKCEIILFGDEEGISWIAQKYGLIHVPDIKRNQYGTPVVDEVFKKAQNLATHSLVCCVQADNILISDFVKAAKTIKRKEFLIFGRRRCVDINKPIDFEDPQWEVKLSSVARGNNTIDRYAMDYFLFPRGICKEVPPFAIGRAGWDNWFIYKFRSQGIPVIDATEAIMDIHQNHDYSHHPEGRLGVYEGAEQKINIELGGGHSHLFSFDDATWVLKSNILLPAISRPNLKRRLETTPILYPDKKVKALMIRMLCSIALFLYNHVPRLKPQRFFPGILRRIRSLFNIT